MKKSSIGVILFCCLTLLFLTGCNTDKDEDIHYKPSEYKHNVAINNAEVSMSDINREIIAMGAETSADVVINTYRESITKLKGHLTTLENTRKKLSEDKDLTNSELRDWNSRYDDSIKAVKNNIQKIEKKQSDFLK